MSVQRKWRSLAAAAAAGAALAAGCGGPEDGAEDAVSLGAAEQALLGRAGGAERFVANQAIVKFLEPPQWSEIRTLGGHRVSPVLALGLRTYLVQLDDLPAPAADGPGTAAVSASSAGVSASSAYGAATLAAVSALAGARDLVEYATENRLAELSIVPSDPLWPAQAWNYERVRLPEAWSVTTGAPGIRIAVIDTGSTAHPDLAWGAGYDVIDHDADPTDPGINHHGIHVAGIAGARANNGLGGVGVCWSCTVVPVRAGHNNGVPEANLIAAIRWVAGYHENPALPRGPRRADVINMSFNLTFINCHNPDYEAVQAAISEAYSLGIAIVASAGNHGAHVATSPADCSGVIGVAASQRGAPGFPDTIPTYSNRGSNVDLVAPGGGVSNSNASWGLYGASIGSPTCQMTGLANPGLPNVIGIDPYLGDQGVVSSWSTWRPAAQLTYSDQCYRHLSGTSMAAPHVAGVIGLMLSVKPSLTPYLIEKYLASTADPLAITCPGPGQCGAGMLDAARAVKAARDGLLSLEVAPSSLTFPLTPIFTESAPLQITVRNVLNTPRKTRLVPSSSALVATCTSGTCTCSAAECTVTLSPGQQAVVALRYQSVPVVPLAGSVTVYADDPAEPPLLIPVNAVTFGHARTSPEIIHFGFEEVGTVSAPETAYLVNIGTGPLVISSLSVTGDTTHYSVAPGFTLPHTVLPGGSAQVQIRCAPTSVGRKNLWVGFNTNATFQGAAVNARCEATAPDGRISVDAPGPEFGEQPIGVLATRAVRVINISTGSNTLTFNVTQPAAPFSLTCVSGCSCTAVACTGSVSSGHGAAVLSLGFQPEEVGKHSSSITFTSNTPGSAPQAITVKGRGVPGSTTDPVPGPIPEEPLPDTPEPPSIEQ